MTRARAGGLDQAPGKVLIIKPSSLGDVVTALPVLRALRRGFPRAHLSWLVSTSCSPLLAGDADLDEIVPFDRRRLGQAWRSAGAAGALAGLVKTLRRGGYDWVIDLQGLFRSGFFARVAGSPVRAGFANAREGAWMFYTHRLTPRAEHAVDRNIALAAMLGLDARRQDMTLSVRPEGRAFAESFRASHAVAGEPYVVLVPPTRWATKLYPARHWRSVAARLSGRAPVAIVGTPADAEMCSQVASDCGRRVIDLAGQTTIAQMVGLIAGASCVVCSDSAAQHIAQAVGTDVVVLIGPTRPERTGPVLGGRCVTAPVPCQGCLRRSCRHMTCMQAIEPESVAAAVEQTLAGGSKTCRIAM
jgi:heptosyltransferase-1/heptosyltransferase-2